MTDSTQPQPRYPAEGQCFGCGHDAHPVDTCDQPAYNGDPSNGPAYCPCAQEMEEMARVLRASRAARTADPDLCSCDVWQHRVAYPASHPARTADPEPTIGHIQHSNSMCQKDGCTCWCQACERHNWRHAQTADPGGLPDAIRDAAARAGYVKAGEAIIRALASETAAPDRTADPGAEDHGNPDHPMKEYSRGFHDGWDARTADPDGLPPGTMLRVRPHGGACGWTSHHWQDIGGTPTCAACNAEIVPLTADPGGLREDDVQEWLQRADGRLLDIFGLWVQGKRDDAWVAHKLVTEGHLAALASETTAPACSCGVTVAGGVGVWKPDASCPIHGSETTTPAPTTVTHQPFCHKTVGWDDAGSGPDCTCVPDVAPARSIPDDALRMVEAVARGLAEPDGLTRSEAADALRAALASETTAPAPTRAELMEQVRVREGDPNARLPNHITGEPRETTAPAPTGYVDNRPADCQHSPSSDVHHVPSIPDDALRTLREQVVAAMPWYDDSNPDYTELDGVLRAATAPEPTLGADD